MVISSDFSNLDQFELFVQSETFSEALERFEELAQPCRKVKTIDLLIELKKHIKNWKGINLINQLVKKSENAVYFPTRRAAHAIKKGSWGCFRVIDTFRRIDIIREVIFFAFRTFFFWF